MQRDLGLNEIVATIARGSSGRRAIAIEVYDGCRRNTIYQLHWELLEDPDLWEPKNVEVQVRRSIQSTESYGEDVMNIRLWQQTPEALPSFNILLVVARNTTQNSDVDPTFASRILTDVQRKFHNLGSSTRVNLEIVRPGTVDDLKEHLERSSAIRGDRYFHLVHFDLHGTIKSKSLSAFLRFNERRENGTVSDELVGVEPGTIGKILSDHGITMVVLNACESAKAEYGENTNIAKIFTRWGVRNIVAMSFAVLESGAKIFLTSFYRHFITEGQNFSAAASLARHAIRRDPDRCARFNLRLRIVDWFVPVVYCYGSPMRITVQKDGCKFSTTASRGIIPPINTNPFKYLCVIGRDFDILRLEKRLLAKSTNVPAVWLCGHPGVGKSTLLQHISSLWTSTSFLEAILYIDFAAHPMRNMDDFITELLVQLPTPTPATGNFLGETGEELVLRLIRDRRVSIMLDGLHVVTRVDNEEHHNYAIISEINVFLRKIVRSQRQSVSKTGCCFFIFSGRLKENYVQFDYCKTATVFELDTLEPRSCEDLLQSIMPSTKPDFKYYELFASLLHGIPAALVHFGTLARTSGYAVQKMYETLLSGNVEKSLESRTNVHQCQIFQELEREFSKLPGKTLAVILTLGWYWHEGPVIKSFYDSLILSRICRDDFELDEVLELVSNWGYIQMSSAPIGAEYNLIISWIHPLFTIYSRIVACALLRSKPDPSTTGWLPFCKDFPYTVTERTMYWIFPKSGLQLASQFLASALGEYQYRYFNFHYYTFATWFLSDINNNSDRGLPNFTAPQKITDSDAVEIWGKRGLQNILFASKICLGQGPIVVPVSHWPLCSMLYYVGSFRKVSTVAEVTVLAKYFEELLYKIESQEGMVLDGLALNFALGLACSLATIHVKYIPSLAKRHLKFLDFGMRMIKLSESRYGPKPDLQKGLLFNLKAELLLADGKEEEAYEAWKRGIKLGRDSLEPSMNDFEEIQRRGLSYDPEILRDNFGSMNHFFDNLENSWNMLVQHHRGEMHPTKEFPEEINELEELNGDNLEHIIHNLNKIDRKYDALEAVASSGPGGGNSLIAVRHHQDFMRDAIRRQDLDQARSHRDAIVGLLESDPTYSAMTRFRRSVNKLIGPMDKSIYQNFFSRTDLNEAKYEPEMMDLFLEVMDTDLYEAKSELADLVVEELD